MNLNEKLQITAQLVSCLWQIFCCHFLCPGKYWMTFDLQCEWCRVKVYFRSVGGRCFGAMQGQLLSTSIVHFTWHHLSGHGWRACVIMHHSEDCFLYIILTYTSSSLLVLSPQPERRRQQHPSRAGEELPVGFICLCSSSLGGGEDDCCPGNLRPRGHRVKFNNRGGGYTQS